MPGSLLRDPFSAADARTAGYSPQEMRDRIRSGVWVPLRRGVYATEATYRATSGEACLRHALLIAAARLVLPRATAAGGWSAAMLNALPVPMRLRNGEFPVTLVAEQGRGRSLDRVDVYRAVLAREHLMERHGVRVTSPARTAVDLALRTRRAAWGDVLAVLDSVMRRRLATRAQLLTVLDQFHGWPGSAQAYELIKNADPNAESPLESASRVFFLEQGIPLPESQVEIYDRAGQFVARVDFLWPAFHTIGEADGRLKYATGEAVYREKRREDLLRTLGYEVVRWDYTDLQERSQHTAQRIRDALARGARRDPAA